MKMIARKLACVIIIACLAIYGKEFHAEAHGDDGFVFENVDPRDYMELDRPYFDTEHMIVPSAELINSISSPCYCEMFGGSRGSIVYICPKDKFYGSPQTHNYFDFGSWTTKTCTATVYYSNTKACCSKCGFTFYYGTAHECAANHQNCGKGYESICTIGGSLPPGIVPSSTGNNIE